MKTNKGFTLMELMVSVSIIAILTAVATSSFTAAQKKSRDSRRTQDMKSIQLAEEQYIALDGNYPVSKVTPWVVNGQTILEMMPADPKKDSSYSYSLTLAIDSYCACASMENENQGNATTSTCTFSGGTGPYFCVKNQQ